MKTFVVTPLLLLGALLAFADSKITKTYDQRPLSEVLIEIDEAAPELSISFIYNKLEDYTVTCTIRDASPIEAIRQAIGFYPVSVKQDSSTVLVEPVVDTEQKLIGRIVDEQGNPLEFANVRLFSPTDNALVTGGMTNRNGDFVIPCNQSRVTVNVSYIGYETLVKSVEFTAATVMNIGTWVMTVGQKTLATVVVEGEHAKTNAERSTYIPTKRQRNAANDATALLQHMMIPQLRVNPASGYVTTLAGEAVAIFIDYLPATAEDLAGMNTQDVKRVEIYDYPKDVRFQNKPHVVNFVMQRYELGGYTKLTTKENVLTDFSAVNTAYSKLAFKKWTLDANVTSDLSNQNHLGSETVETFRLPTQTVTRTETFADGRQRNRQTSVSLRATYQSEKVQLANRVDFLDDNTPKDEKYGNVFYQPIIFTTSSSVSRQDSRSITPTYEGDWYFQLPKQWMLNVVPTIQYSHNKQNRFYQEGSSLLVENLVKEDVTQINWQLGFGKNFTQKHSIYFGSYGITYNSCMNYNGSILAHQKMNFIALGVPIKYVHQSKKLNLSAMATALYQHYNVNDEVKSDWTPAFITSADYAFNQKNKLQATFKTALSAADGSLRNPSVIQDNEILYYNGNPQVDNYTYCLGNLQYTWLPSNTFNASAFVEYIYDNNYYGNIWKPYLDDKILETIDNVGNQYTTKIGANFTLHLLDGKLQLNAAPKLYMVKTTGTYHEKGKPFFCDINASYYFGNFYLNAGYETPDKSFRYRKVQWQRDRSYYYLSAGWGNAAWKAKVDIVNPFRTDWRDTRSTIVTPLYTRTAETYNAASHQRLKLTISYIFNYGKKVKPGNELGTATAGQSSIL